MTPFDFIKNINEKTGDLYTGNEKDYNEYVINVGLSFFPDTIFLVNEANKYNLTGKKHYDFLYNTIEKRKRYSEWFKKPTNVEELKYVAEYYDVSDEKAKEFLRVLKPSKIEEIKQKMKFKGGNYD